MTLSACLLCWPRPRGSGCWLQNSIGVNNATIIAQGVLHLTDGWLQSHSTRLLSLQKKGMFAPWHCELASDTWISFGLLLMLTSCYLVKYKIPKLIPRCVKTVQSNSLYNVRVAVGELGSFYLITAHFWFQLWCFLVLQLVGKQYI